MTTLYNQKLFITDDELRKLYTSGLSSIKISKQYNVDRSTVQFRLKKLNDWSSVKKEGFEARQNIKLQNKTLKGICISCGKEFFYNKKRKYCTHRCYYNSWQRNWRSQNKEEINRKKRELRKNRKKKLTEKQLWLLKFTEKAKEVHKRNIDKVANKLVDKGTSWKNGLVTRSKKHNVNCNVTVEELRNLLYNAYGKQCKYCDKILTINTIALDHIVPISKGGASNIDNLQVICKTSNAIKGSLNEESFKLLLDWLDTVSEELKKDVLLRLAWGAIKK